jgi:hypothetical protein
MTEVSQEGEQYAELARAVYAAAERERWNTEKIFKMLNSPQEFIKYTEQVSASQILIFLKQARAQEERDTDPIVSRMALDAKKRELKKQQIAE